MSLRKLDWTFSILFGFVAAWSTTFGVFAIYNHGVILPSFYDCVAMFMIGMTVLAWAKGRILDIKLMKQDNELFRTITERQNILSDRQEILSERIDLVHKRIDNLIHQSNESLTKYKYKISNEESE